MDGKKHDKIVPWFEMYLSVYYFPLAWLSLNFTLQRNELPDTCFHFILSCWWVEQHGLLSRRRTAAVHHKSVEIVVQLRGRHRQRRRTGPLDGADDTLDGEAVVPQVRGRLEGLVLHETVDTPVGSAPERGNIRGLRVRRGAGRVDEAEAVEHGGVSGAADELDVDGDVPPRVLFVAVREERDGPAVAGRVERRRLDGAAHADAPGVGVAFHREQVRAHRDLARRRRHRWMVLRRGVKCCANSYPNL